ncbi:hypothetical protein [Sediminibacterium ginsengisoli]|uniref:Uncharacterized protein n=1 Tax=Sediminibacterium ginsengisoli TaxID=413434 RepID=A0A1T4P016_9BACT|nr:hypothetical protein [Sediminibacterium ginsengisoli]SJZ84769.1 hypothetical protein SAMN04488132_10573 [Sediminibacterium ginsengisoli]
MEKDLITKFHDLHSKSISVVKKYENLPEKDIRLKHIEILSGQIATALISLKIGYRFTETNKEEFEFMFNNDRTQIENYIHTFKQTMIESILDTALFQTELVFRILYSTLEGGKPGDEGNIQKIISVLYEDTQNNWQKEEARVMVLFWTMRNTVHTGGIYSKNPNGYTITYKGKEYKFEFMKAFGFLENSHIIDLLSDFLDSLDYLFNSDKIKNLNNIDHPSYYALGYQ